MDGSEEKIDGWKRREDRWIEEKIDGWKRREDRWMEEKRKDG